MKSAIAQSRRRLAAAITFTLFAQGAHAGATITVNSADDDAASTFCNLRNAITSAMNGASVPACVGQVSGTYADPDTIQFATGLSNATITLSQGQFVISGVAIDLVGSGQTINAAGLSPVFSIDNSSTLSVNDLTLTSGHSASSGGAIFVGSGSMLTLTNSTISNSSAVTQGGAIYATGATVNVNGATISGNVATGSGGGVYAKTTTTTLINSNISANSSNNQGGGIFADGGMLTIATSTLSTNTATDLGGGILSSNGILSVDHSTLTGNAGLRSGAFYLGPQSATTITRSTISGNTGNCSSSFCAGGIYAWESDVAVIDSTIASNAAVGMQNFQAGAIYLYDAHATVVNSTITGNSASGTGATGNDYLAGALWELHDPTYTNGGLALINTTVSGNTASASVSAGTYVGGGIAVGVQGTGGDIGVATLANTIVTANSPANTDVIFKASATTWTTGYSLLGSTQNIAAFNDPANHNIFSDAPGLGPLQDNGGPTQTMALLAGSPALRTGSVGLAVYSGVPLNYDQRGISKVRTFSGTIDIGAFEYQDDRLFANGIEPMP